MDDVQEASLSPNRTYILWVSTKQQHHHHHHYHHLFYAFNNMIGYVYIKCTQF